jgi:endonuclease/exonuclease/phosphatase family metal-dependent hydrolase
MNVRFQVLSWNVHGTPFTRERQQRLQRVGAAILRQRPDVALLQEVWFPRDAACMIAALGATYQPVDVPRGGLLGRQGGLLTLVRAGSGWAVRGARFHRFTLAAAAWKLWQGDGVARKGVQRVDLESAGQRLVVLNAHLQSDYRWNDYARVRSQQLHDLRHIAAQVDGGTPVLAAGDLNTRPTESLYADLRTFWDDLTEAMRQRAGTGTCLNPDGSDAGWRDYILARRDPTWSIDAADVQCIANQRPDHPYSDHHGIAATLRIAATARS